MDFKELKQQLKNELTSTRNEHQIIELSVSLLKSSDSFNSGFLLKEVFKE